MHPSLQRLGRLYLEKDRVHTNGDNEYAFIHVTYSAAHERGAEAAWLDVLLESSIWRKEPCGPSTCRMLHEIDVRVLVLGLGRCCGAPVRKFLGITRCLLATTWPVLSGQIL